MSSYELNPPKQKGVNLEGLGGWICSGHALCACNALYTWLQQNLHMAGTDSICVCVKEIARRTICGGHARLLVSCSLLICSSGDLCECVYVCMFMCVCVCAYCECVYECVCEEVYMC